MNAFINEDDKGNKWMIYAKEGRVVERHDFDWGNVTLAMSAETAQEAGEAFLEAAELARQQQPTEGGGDGG